MEISQGKKTRILSPEEWLLIISPYSRIVFDIGTGDGKFPYESAKNDPHTLWVGIDADRSSLEEYAHKIYRKPSKGGLPNVLYVIANANQLPDELYKKADQIWIILPWGSLLQGMVQGQPDFLQNLSAVAKPGCEIRVFVNYDLRYEGNEIGKLQLPTLSDEYIRNILAPQYLLHGLQLASWETLDNLKMVTTPSTWARRLGYGRTRTTTQMVWIAKQ